ncbi:nucleosome-remodeling factor subunit BPTF isoform X2 [Hydra vulgaris]|uniref:nucleosome-remodeling factor subunit BPTF isoform X2 n=1 Tax=Hydra vulgaris TaxID=6087 RepID=UPI001F5EF3CD|nr:nucleosome-remodeling factor subunit BPTF isoform X2 [Hydra vulgaris]
MVRARGGSAKNNNLSRAGKGKYVENAESSYFSPTKTKKRRRSKKPQKFAEYAKNFVFQSDSDSDDSNNSIKSFDSLTSLISAASLINDDFPPISYNKTVHRSTTPDPEPIILSPLLLPPSSGDLVIDSQYLMKSLEIFEVVRHFGRVLKISPFSFEHFCDALHEEVQLPPVITETYISFIKAIFAEDERNQVMYGNADEKDIVNLHLYLIDEFTWPEIIRSYINSDPGKFSPNIIEIVENPKFPFVSIQDKLDVLCHLAKDVLSLNIIREEIQNEGLFISDDYCRKCGRMGDLLCCELCPAVYHLECLSPPLLEVPENEWFCPICAEQHVKGVSDVLFELDRTQVYRNEQLGVDRHKRIYWFMVRRIIVEGVEDIFYYSCQEHLDELIAVLREEDNEVELLTVIEDRYEEIVRHMKVTEELYNEQKGDLVSFLERPRDIGKLVESKDFIQYQLEKDQERLEEENHFDDLEDSSPLNIVIPAVTFVPDENVPLKINVFTKNICIIEQLLTRKKLTALEEEVLDVLTRCVKLVTHNCDGDNLFEVDINAELEIIQEGHDDYNLKDNLVDEIDKEYENFQNEIEIKDPIEAAQELDKAGTPLQNSEKKNKELKVLLDDKCYYKLGTNSCFSTYVNQYSSSMMAKGKQDLQAEKDKRRILGNKFCLNAFKWYGDCQKGYASIISTLRSTLLSFESSIPTAFLHPSWYVLLPCWIKAVRLCNTPKEFAVLLLLLEEMIKPVIMVNTWKESSGALKLQRKVGEPKAVKLKPSSNKKVEKDTQFLSIDVEDSDSEDELFKPTCVPVKFSWPPKHKLWEVKGEEYRIKGYGAWCWETSYFRGVKRKSFDDQKKVVNKKQKIESVLRKVKHKKGTQFVKKDALNVIESLPSEFDKRDEHIDTFRLLKEDDIYEDDEPPTSPLILIKSANPYPLSVENKTLELKFGDLNWTDETEMEIVQASLDIPQTLNANISFNHITQASKLHMSDQTLFNEKTSVIKVVSPVMKSSITEHETFDVKNSTIFDLKEASIPSFPASSVFAASGLTSNILAQTVLDTNGLASNVLAGNGYTASELAPCVLVSSSLASSVLTSSDPKNNFLNSGVGLFSTDIAVPISESIPSFDPSIITKPFDTNENKVLIQKKVNKNNVVEDFVLSSVHSGNATSVQSSSYSLLTSSFPISKISLINNPTLLSESVHSVAGSFSVLKNLVQPAFLKDMGNISVDSSPKVTAKPTVFNMSSISTAISQSKSQQSVMNNRSFINNSSSSSLNVLHNFSPHLLQSKPAASVSFPVCDKPVYISGPRLLSTLNNGNLSIQANQFLTVSPKVQLPVMNHCGLSQFKLPTSSSNHVSDVFSKTSMSFTFVSSVTTSNKLPSIVSSATVINKQPIVINGENNIPLLKALVDAGISNQAGGIMAIKTSTGHFIIRTRNKGNFNLESSNITSNSSGISITRMSSPSGLNILTSKQTGMTPVRPKSQVLSPQVVSLTKFQTTVSNSLIQPIHPKVPASTVSLSNPTSSDNTSVNVQKKILIKNIDSGKLNYNEEFYNKNHDRMKPLRVNFDKPELLLQHEIKRLQRRRKGFKSIFTLPKHLVKMLARKGGFIESPQFLYNSKTCTNWPECLPRPTFQVAWRYRLAEANHISTVLHLLRMIHCCFKWDIINNKPPKGVNRSITSNKGIITIEIVEGKPARSDGLMYNYNVRKMYQPFKTHKKVKLEKPLPKIEVDTTPKSRSSATGIQLRERTAPLKYTIDNDFNSSSSEDDDNGVPFPKERTITHSWHPEHELDLWEIRQFWERVENERNLKRQHGSSIVVNQSLKQKVIDVEKQHEDEKESTKWSPTLLQKTPISIKSLSPIRPAVLTSSNSTQTNFPKEVSIAGMKAMQSTLINKYLSTQSNRLVIKTHEKSPVSLLKHSPSMPKKAQQPIIRAKIVTEPDYVIAKTVLDGIVRKIEVQERKEKRKHEKLMSIINKQRAQEFARLQSNLMIKRNNLRLEVMRKREILEELLIQEVEKELFPELAYILNLEKPFEEEEEEILIDSPVKVKKTVERKRKVSEVVEVVDVVKKKRTSIDTKPDLYCVCRTPYDETQFYVGCDLCNGWFHGSCIGITEEEAESIDEYICEECNKEKVVVEEGELYCICRQPYDESKFYIGCDFCQDWFHGTCVGMTQAEASLVEEYKCPNCRKKTTKELVELKPLTSKELDGLKRLHRSLINHKMAWPFMKPVDKKDVKDYYEKIKEPMDLQTMSTKLRDNSYSTLTDFVADVSRIFDNCRYYNPADSSFYRCAEVLENYFVQKLKGFKNTLKQR